MDYSHGKLEVDPSLVLVESYAVNERMNQIVLEDLDPAAWRAKLASSSGRTIAQIFTHVHNVRRKWIRLSAPHLAVPVALNRATCSQEDARSALAESGARCCDMLREALSLDGPGLEETKRVDPAACGGDLIASGSGEAGRQSRVATFNRDGWAKAWPAGAAMAAYMLTHDAHHRGQVLMLARQLGYPLSDRAAQGIWVWERLWKECGFIQIR